MCARAISFAFRFAEIDPMDPSLLPGQTLSATIPYVGGVDQFYCHLNSRSVELMETLIAQECTDVTVVPYF